jgi:hypothetical protein
MFKIDTGTWSKSNSIKEYEKSKLLTRGNGTILEKKVYMFVHSAFYRIPDKIQTEND